MTPRTEPGPALAATSTTAVGTVSKRTIAALASHFADPRETVLDSPVVVAGIASPALGEEGTLSRDLALAMAALITAAGDRTDVKLRTGDCGGCTLLVTAARRLGWLPAQVTRCPEGSHAPAIGATPAHRAVALFRGCRGDTGTAVAAAAIFSAGVPLSSWCSECGPVPHGGPCEQHSPDTVRAAWRVQARGASAAA